MEIFKLFGSVFVDTSKAEESLSKTDKKAEGLGQTFLKGVEKAGKFAVGITAAAGAAAVGLGVKAVKAASDFETSFAKVTTLLGDTENLDAYKQSIIDLSNKMGKSTDEISEAVYGAISAGVAAADAVGFVEGAMKLAEGGFTDAATAVDVVTTAINAYGLSAEDATAISDKLILTQNLGKTTVDELASSMGKIIPTANALGVDIDSLCAGYAVLTSNGIATAESTTYMNSMLNELGKSGTKASDALHEYFAESYEGGLGFADLIDMGYSVTEVLEILQEVADESGKSMADMFGSAEAGKAAQVLINNSEKYTEVLDQMGDAAGTTEEAYNKMHGTMEAQMKSLKNNMQNVFIQLGEKLLPIANAVMQTIADHMPEIIDKAVEYVGGLVDKVVEFVGIVKQYVSDNSDEIQERIAKIKEVFELVWGEIQTVWDSVGKPIFEVIKTVVSEVKEYFSEHFPEMLAILQKVFDGMADSWENKLKPCLKAIGDFIENVLAPLFGFVFKEIILPAVSGVFKEIGHLWEDVLKPIFDGICEFLEGVFTGNWKKIFQGLADIVKGIFGSIVDLVKLPLNALIDMLNKVIDGFNKVKLPDWMPGELSGKGLNIPHIPALAEGGDITTAGAVLVGEQGPEFLNLPRGARVTPLDKAGSGDNGAVLEALQAIRDELAGMQIVLDTGAVVGEIAPAMDGALGDIYERNARWTS